MMLDFFQEWGGGKDFWIKCLGNLHGLTGRGDKKLSGVGWGKNFKNFHDIIYGNHPLGSVDILKNLFFSP